jgi:hypothetical protein
MPTEQMSLSDNDVMQAQPQEADPLLRDLQMPYREIFYPLGFGIEILSNDPDVLEAARDSWGNMQARQSGASLQIRIGVVESEAADCPPAPIFRSQRHLVSIVADADNYVVCDLHAGFALAWITRATAQHRLYLRYYILEAAAYMMICSTFATAIHAACVSRYGRGFLLCGESGAGKSTLAYACARAGFTYTSDDSSYLLRNAQSPCVTGNVWKFRFRPAATSLFPELAGRELTLRMEGKPSIEIPTAEFPKLITSTETLIHYVILLRRTASGPAARLVPVATSKMMHYFEENLHPSDYSRDAHLDTIQQLKSAQCFELHYSTLDDAIHCLDLLAGQHAS